jgi:hypothetical protein
VRRITAKLGRTVYEIEETSNPAGVVRLLRTSAGGKTEQFYVPISLLTDYFAEHVLPEMLKKAIKR